MTNNLDIITASEAKLITDDYENRVFVNSVYSMIRKSAKKGGNKIFLYQEECAFLMNNKWFLNKLKDDGFQVSKIIEDKITIIW